MRAIINDQYKLFTIFITDLRAFGDVAYIRAIIIVFSAIADWFESEV